MANRKNDAIDILNDNSHGYQGTKPKIVIEDRNHTEEGYMRDNIPAIVIKRNINFQREALGPKRENRMWILVFTITGDTDDNLDVIFQEMRKTFNRYTTDPSNFDALSTGNSYDIIRVVAGLQDFHYPHYVLRGDIQLIEQLVDVEA